MNNVVEGGKIKCEQYWPSSGTQTFGPFTISVLSETTLPYFIIRTLKVWVSWALLLYVTLFPLPSNLYTLECCLLYHMPPSYSTIWMDSVIAECCKSAPVVIHCRWAQHTHTHTHIGAHMHIHTLMRTCMHAHMHNLVLLTDYTSIQWHCGLVVQGCIVPWFSNTLEQCKAEVAVYICVPGCQGSQDAET